jgi:low temperature requirement protein LtrA
LPPGGEYLADRNRALFVIALGEVILAIGSSLTGRGFSTDQTVAFVVTFAVTALIWRIYIFRAGEDIGPAIQASANPDRLGTLVSYAHLVMIAGLVVTSVGAQLVIDDPFGHPRATTTVTVLGGTALFLAGRALLRYLVYSRLFVLDAVPDGVGEELSVNAFRALRFPGCQAAGMHQLRSGECEGRQRRWGQTPTRAAA